MDKAPTINDVAREAGVSKTTAVFILNERPNFQAAPATRERVRDAVRKLGYRRSGLARALSTGRIFTVGVVLRMERLSRSSATYGVYAKDVLASVARTCAEAGLRMTLIPFPVVGALSVDDVVDRRVDGLIVISLYDDSFARQLYASGFPTVTIGSGYAERRVAFDQRGGAREATEHLLKLGHTRIVHAFGENAGALATEERRAGFSEALRAHGLDPDAPGRQLSRPKAVAALRLPEGERPTAIFAYNDGDAWAIGVAAREMGLRVPEDLSLVGFDNNVLAETSVPPLTTVENPLDAQTCEALRILHGLWKGKEVAPAAPLPARLIIRRSTTAPAAPRSFIPTKETLS